MPRTIAVVTGSRAEFGLLRSVICALDARSNIVVEVIAGGEHDHHLAGTMSEVMEGFPETRSSEFDDVVAEIQAFGINPIASVAVTPDIKSDFGVRLGVEVVRCAVHLIEMKPDFVVVLGDRIEAFAATAAAAVSGIRVAHLHGGDRAEGIADESLRHAISKLAHLHLPATDLSANRLIAMGENKDHVHVVGSPAMDELPAMTPLNDAEFTELGWPAIVVLLHPTGDDDDVERKRAARLLDLCRRAGRTLALHPNHDPGRGGIVTAIEESNLPQRSHLPRQKFIGLLRRAKVLVGNSSAGLIEAAAIPIWCLNVGRRQAGRERAANVLDAEDWDYQTIERLLGTAMRTAIGPIAHPYGDGRTGTRAAELLATCDLETVPLRKQNTY